METKENKPMPSNPKPTDEVQLNIETVTPDTEKNVVPTEDLTQEQSKDQNTNPEKIDDDQISETNEKSADDSEETTDDQVVEKNPVIDEVSKDDGQSNDPSEEVETVSP